VFQHVLGADVSLKKLFDTYILTLFDATGTDFLGFDIANGGRPFLPSVKQIFRDIHGFSG